MTILKYDKQTVLDWLAEQPADMIVHDVSSSNICGDCTVARMIQDKFGDPQVRVGMNTVTDSSDTVYDLSLEISTCIHDLDMAAAKDEENPTLTAAQAYKVVEKSVA